MEELRGIFWRDRLGWKSFELGKEIGDLVPWRLVAHENMAQGPVYGVIVERSQRQAQDSRLFVEFGDEMRPTDRTKPSVLASR